MREEIGETMLIFFSSFLLLFFVFPLCASVSLAQRVVSFLEGER